ncbi:MAG: tetratricopeptide repeat protein [Nitrososphaerota archaeon]
MAEGRIDEALEEYRKASELAPDKIELRFWQALTMYLHGRRGRG